MSNSCETVLRVGHLPGSNGVFVRLTASGGSSEQNERAILYINTSVEYLKKAAEMLRALLNHEVVPIEETQRLADEIAYRYGV